jgi:hypothetical protein
MSRRIGAVAGFLVALQVALVLAIGALDGATQAAAAPLGVVAWIVLTAQAISSLASPLVGALIVSRRPSHPVGWILCALYLGWDVTNLAGSYVRYGILARPGALPGVDLVAGLYFWPGQLSFALSIVLALLLPDGAWLSPRWRFLGRLTLALGALAAIGAALAPGPVDDSIGVRIANPFGLGGPVGVAMLVFSGLSLVMQLLYLPAVVSLILRFRRARDRERLQIKWIAAAYALGAALIAPLGVLLIIYPTTAEQPLWVQGFRVVVLLSGGLPPVCIAVAILRHNLYDIDVIIRRTLVYGALTALLGALYFGGVALSQVALTPLAGASNDLGVVGSTLAIAALFQPLRRGVQAFIDRRFYRGKYDAAHALARFNADVRDEVALDRLTARLLAAVDETMQPTRVSLWLRADSGRLVGGQRSQNNKT